MDLDRSLSDLADTYRPGRQPSLDDLVARSRSRRRTAVLTSGAVATLAVVGLVLVAPWDGAHRPSVVSVTTPQPTVSDTGAPVGCGSVRISGIVDYVNFVKVGTVVMSAGVGDPITVRDGDLGEAVERVTCSLEAETHGTGSTERMSSGTAAFLPEGTTVYAVHGFDPQCRVAAVFNGKLTAYVAGDEDAKTYRPAACALMPGLQPDGPPSAAGDERGAPSAYQQRTHLPDCGSVDGRTFGRPVDAGGAASRACFLAAVDASASAEVRSVLGTIDAGPAFEVLRTEHGAIELWSSGYNSISGAREGTEFWHHYTCTGLDRARLSATGCTLAD